ncbi:hypothetical protein [Noviherbaspirillum cavernae]|nr:hypothetical protein [Noviherbaspirillum cavernae]
MFAFCIDSKCLQNFSMPAANPRGCCATGDSSMTIEVQKAQWIVRDVQV